MKKIAVFIPDYFWSSIPYEGLTMWNALKNDFQCDLLMFSNDIRLNKVFNDEFKFKYKFDPKLFHQANPVIMQDWHQFFDLSKSYDLILSQTHLFPKIRSPFKLEGIDSLRKSIKCPLLVWDIGGTDILSCCEYASYMCVKGQLWKEWLVKCFNFPEDKIFITGSPHYDYYNHADEIFPKEARPITKEEFKNKYKLNEYKSTILIAPSNPGSHKEQFAENIKNLKFVARLATTKKIKLLIKTYPHDYVFHDRSGFYTGIYHRLYERQRFPQPQYETIKAEIPCATIIESQDHFGALMYCDKLYNMSGSHVAWETYFTNCESYSINYTNQPYYAGASYLSKSIVLPDAEVNINMKNIVDLFDNKKKNKKNCEDYFTKEFAHQNILNVVKKILS